jgi:prefoldin subunit 5
MLDWTISVGNIIQVVTLIGAGISVFLGLSFRLKGLEKEVEKLSTVVVTLAIQTTKIDHIQKRIEELERDRVDRESYLPQILKRHQI